MGDSSPVRVSTSADVHERHRRVYQILLAVAICLAVVGSPMLMEGVVALVMGMSPNSPQQAGSLGSGFVRFLIGAAPMGLAAYTWHRVKSLERLLEQEEQNTQP
jgi:hypothetical protein